MEYKRRVAVVGVGVVSALGLTAREFWDGLVAGRCGIGPVELFDTTAYRTHLGAQVKGLDPASHFDRRPLRRMSRCDMLGLIAAREAVSDSGLDIATLDHLRAGVVLGGGAGGMLSGTASAWRSAASGNSVRMRNFLTMARTSKRGSSEGPITSTRVPSGLTWRFSHTSRRATTRSPTFAFTAPRARLT